MCSPLQEGQDGNSGVKKYQKARVFVILLYWQQCSEHMVCLRQGSYKLRKDDDHELLTVEEHVLLVLFSDE